MVGRSPVNTTINPAPLEILRSRTGIVKPVGTPFASGFVENEYCVFAIQTGNCPNPYSSETTLLSGVLDVHIMRPFSWLPR